MPYTKTNFTDGGGEPISAANLNKMEEGIESGANHSESTSNPHSVNKEQVGLGNVDNTSDLNKPISKSAQTALNAKQDTLVSGTNIKTINGESVVGSGDIVVEGGLGSLGFSTNAVNYNSGKRYFPTGRPNTTGVTTGTRSLKLVPFLLSKELKINAFEFRAHNAVASDTLLGIYSVDTPSTNATANLVYDTGIIAVPSATGDINQATQEITLQAGVIYFTAFWSDIAHNVSALSCGSPSTETNFNSIFGASSATFSFSIGFSMEVGLISALPASIALQESTATNMPIFGMVAV